jgi:hypothetical protein
MDPEEVDWTSAMVPNVRQLVPSLFFAGVLPVLAYALLRPHVGSDAVALAIVMVFPVVEIAVARSRSGRFDPIGIIALIGIGAGLLGALLTHGDAFLLKLRDSVVTGLFGLVCLASLPRPKPAMFYVARAFATAGDPARAGAFEELYTYDGVPRRFRTVTAVWGAVLVGEAAGRTVLAVTLSTGVFLAVSNAVYAVVLGGLLWWTVRYSRAGENATREARLNAEPPPG